MLFNTYHINVSKEARKLAKTYFEFVTRVLDRRVKYDRAASLIENWAKDFDGYVRETKTPYERIREVLDWYIKSDTSRYTYPCPISFLDHFRTLEQRWRWSYRPVPVEELTTILDKLFEERWPGNKEDLITVVSKSVYAVRNVLKNTSCLAELPIKGVERRVASVNAFVIDHFTQWRKRNINRNDTPLWTAEISENLILDAIVSEWKKMGYGPGDCQKMRGLLLNGCKRYDA